MKAISPPSSTLSLLGAILSCACSLPEAGAQTVLTLPEIAVTSFRGRLTMGKTTESGTATPVPVPQPGQPVRVPPGTRLDVEGFSSSHAIVSLPGAGACMITEGSSLRLPETSETDMTVTFDRHISGASHCMLLNISAAEMAKHSGTVFRTKNKFEGNSARSKQHARPNVVVTTVGARCFIIDSQSIQKADFSTNGACTVGVLDGAVTVEELVLKQKVDLKAGQVVLIDTENGIGKPRAPTKAELAFDIGCKLAVLGREAPARLPPTMKTTAPTNLPGTKVNSLGMVFVPVPGTKVIMCVHETRYQDFMPFLATQPQMQDGLQRVYVNGVWGWEDHPVAVMWEQARAFCAWLSQKEGKKYRLPTDEEWSHAVGIGTKERRGAATTAEELSKQEGDTFPWGGDWPPAAGSGNFADVSWKAHNLKPLEGAQLSSYDDGFIATAPVMSFKPNKLGMYDMAGNVSEWCEDWYNSGRQARVARGSSHLHDSIWAFRSSYRWPYRVDRKSDVGFRLVLEQP